MKKQKRMNFAKGEKVLIKSMGVEFEAIFDHEFSSKCQCVVIIDDRHIRVDDSCVSRLVERNV